MALNIKNREVEELATQVSEMARETKTEAIRRALLERKERLQVRRGQTGRRARLERLLREQIWPQIPEEVRGKRLTKQEREEILGYRREGF